MQYSLAIRICKEHQRRDVETLVRLTGKRGRYKTAIKHYLKRRRYDSALKLAHEYLSKGFLKQGECYGMLKDVVYRHIKSRLLSESNDFVKFVEIIPDVKEQIHFLKQARLYKEACDILEKNEKFESAYRICRAQHLYNRGIEIAKRLGVNHEHSMILFMAEHWIQLVQSKQSIQQDSRSKLEEILTFKDLAPKHRARASLLLACKILNDNTETEISRALKLCIEAWDTYKMVRSNAGEIEAFNMLTKIREKTREHTVQHGIKLLDTVSKVQKVCELLRKRAAAFTTDLHDIEDFYGLEKLGSTVYCMPRQHGFFFKPSYDKPDSNDADGMLQLDQESVLKQIEDHYQKFVENWKKYIPNVKEPWETKVRLSFPFHSELQGKVLYLQKVHRKFPTKQIEEYLQMCKVALQLSKLNPSAIIPASVIVPLQTLLSPFSQLSLPFERENYLFVRKSEVLQEFLGGKFCKEIHDQVPVLLDSVEKIPNIDRWLQAWKIMHITGEGNVAIMNNEINKQRTIINSRVHILRRYDPSRHAPFTYSYSKKSGLPYQSIFAMWELACKLYREGKALHATRISLAYFVQVIARRRSLRKTFSVENLINILTIQSTALLAMISASKFRQKQRNIFIIPESFELIVKTFNLINCDRPDHCQLLPACLKTLQEVPPEIVLQRSIKFLSNILDLLTGFYRMEYKPLKRAIHNGTRTEAIHCLVLALTVFGNLVLYDLLPTHDCEILFKEIIGILESKVTSRYKLRKMVQETYFKMTSSTKFNTKALFEEVIRLLLEQADLKLMCLQTVTSLGKPKIVLKPYSPQQIPHVDFKWAPYNIPTRLLSRNQPDSIAKVQVHVDDFNPAEDVLTQAIQRQLSLLESDENIQSDAQTVFKEDGEEATNDQIDDEAIQDDRENKDELNDGQQNEASIIDSGDEEESEDEDVIKELSAAAVAEVKLVEAPKPDPELEEEKKEFLNEGHCIICGIEIEEAKYHFKSQTHMLQKRLYLAYNNALCVYNCTQKHLIELIANCRGIDHTDYELERAALHAEQLKTSNNEEIAKEGHDSNWESRKQKLEKLQDKILKEIKDLDDQLKQAEQKKIESQEAEHSEEEKSEEEETTDHDGLPIKGKLALQLHKRKRV